MQIFCGIWCVNFIPTWCFNPCRPVLIRVGILIQKRPDPCIDKTQPVALKVCSGPLFKEQDQNVYLKLLYYKQTNKIDCSGVDGLCFHCNIVLDTKGCFYNFCLCHEVRSSLKEEETQVGSKKRELDELWRSYIPKKVVSLFETWKSPWWRQYKTTTKVKLLIRKFPLQTLTHILPTSGENKGRKLFCYIQCDT